MRPWFCVQTNPRQEELARKSLRLRGVTTFLPMYLHRREDRHTVKRLVFPGYLFVSTTLLQWALVTNRDPKSFLGVKGILSYRPADSEYRLPQPLASQDIERLREVSLAYRQAGAQEPDLVITAGCYVRVKEGPLAELAQRALVEWAEADRVSLLVQMFNRAVSVEFYRSDVTRVE